MRGKNYIRAHPIKYIPYMYTEGASIEFRGRVGACMHCVYRVEISI